MRQHWLRLLLSRDSFERSCTCTVFENEQKRSHNATFNRVSLDQSYLFEIFMPKMLHYGRSDFFGAKIQM